MEDLYEKYASLEARIKHLESKTVQAIQVNASTTASKNTNINTGTVTIDWNLGTGTHGFNYGTLFTHSTVTNPTRITFNRKCAVMFGLSIAGNTTTANASLLAQVRLNGTTTIMPNSYINVPAAGGTNDHDAGLTGIYFGLDTGDYFEARCVLTGAAGTVTLFSTISTFWIKEIFV